MENMYGIGITNRYQLFLNEDEDPLEVLKVQEQEKELKKKTKLSEKENKGKQQETKGKPVVNIRKGIKETQNIKSQDQQQHKVKEENVKLKGSVRTGPERKFNNESREERNNQRNRPEKPLGGPGGDFQREERGERGERRFERRPGPEGDGPREGGRGRPMGTGRGIGRGRGRGGRGGFDGRGKREFDRQSGSDKTGIKAVDKRDGAGAHNWGSNREAIDDMDNLNRPAEDIGDWSEKVDNEVATTEPSTETKEHEGQNGVEGEEGDSAANVEEERKELTLDEWKALKGNRSKPQYNLRKAGEGEDLTQWKKMYALQKKKEDEDEDDEEEYDSSDYPQRVGRQKRVLDIDFTFADTRMGGRGRGGRGGGRGVPRGASRGGGGAPRGSSSDNGPTTRDTERDPGTYGGPRNSRPSVPKPREREQREPGSYAGPRNSSRQSAPKVDDEHDFPSLG